MIEYYKYTLINQAVEHYFSACSNTLDVCEFVPQKYLKKVQKKLFKEFKSKLWAISFEYRKFKKYWKSHKNSYSDKHLKSILKKYNLEFKALIKGEQDNFSLNRKTANSQQLEYVSANSCEGFGESSPTVEYHDCTNQIEGTELAFDSPKQEDCQATANINEQLEGQSPDKSSLEPL